MTRNGWKTALPVFLLSMTLSTAVLAAGGLGVSELGRSVPEIAPAPDTAPFRVVAGTPFAAPPVPASPSGEADSAAGVDAASDAAGDAGAAIPDAGESRRAPTVPAVAVGGGRPSPTPTGDDSDPPPRATPTRPSPQPSPVRAPDPTPLGSPEPSPAEPPRQAPANPPDARDRNDGGNGGEASGETPAERADDDDAEARGRDGHRNPRAHMASAGQGGQAGGQERRSAEGTGRSDSDTKSEGSERGRNR